MTDPLICMGSFFNFKNRRADKIIVSLRRVRGRVCRTVLSVGTSPNTLAYLQSYENRLLGWAHNLREHIDFEPDVCSSTVEKRPCRTSNT